MSIKDLYDKLIERIKPEHVMKNEPMCKYTSFKIGGPADLLIMPNGVEEVQHAIKVCKAFGVEYFIMGNGSNLLVRDKGIRGVGIKIAENFSKVEIEGDQVIAQGGILLSKLSKAIMEKGLEGFEFASGIPGTLGGAIAMNAGAYGGEMKDVLQGVSVVDDRGNIVYLNNEELELGYRSSMVQKKGWIVLEAEMKFKKGDYSKIKAKVKDFTERRTSKQPLSLPSAGSTFKRPPGHFAGKLIEDAGLKGVRVGGAQVSELHGGFVVNVDHATAEDVIHLIKLVQKTVRDQFGVELTPEVKIIGEE